jgi:hypothetical protein
MKDLEDEARGMTDYDKVLQAIKEMRPAAKVVKEKPATWWLDRFEDAVKQLKEKTNERRKQSVGNHVAIP